MIHAHRQETESCTGAFLTLQQRQQQPNTGVQFHRQQVKSPLALFFCPFNEDWVGDIPVGLARSVEGGTVFVILILP